MPSLVLLPLLAPLALLCAACLAHRQFARPPGWALRSIEAAALAALGIALVTAARTGWTGAASSPLLGAAGVGISVRLDLVSATLLLLVAFIGWIVLRYSARYLDGEPRQGAFTRDLCVAIAAAMLLVLSGNLVQLAIAWVATSLCVQRLLLFYPQRLAARRAARKKFVVARLGDVALLAAAVLLGWCYASTDIATILAGARAGEGGDAAAVAAALIALASLLKSAQFPSHGWLLDVIETPTPVSALLHAGIVNAGGFLVIRFADVMLLSPAALAGLALVGGFSALIGGLAMITQPAVKTALAWSTIAQMGFMLLQCGLGLFAFALLHVVAHSLYKAHAFLSAGGAVERVTAQRRPGPVATPGVAAVAAAFAFALLGYGAARFVLDPAGEAPQATALGMLLVLGIAYLLAQGFAGAAPRALALRTGASALLAALGYFALQAVALRLAAGTLPPPPAADALTWTVIVLAVGGFTAVALAQTTLPLWREHRAALALRVHLANGLYANALLDRLLGSWRLGRAS